MRRNQTLQFLEFAIEFVNFTENTVLIIEFGKEIHVASDKIYHVDLYTIHWFPHIIHTHHPSILFQSVNIPPVHCAPHSTR